LNSLRVDPSILTSFKKQLHEAMDKRRDAWSASRRLVAPALACQTVQRLRAALAGSALEPGLRDSLSAVLLPGETGGLRGISGETLRELTGLNPTKAVRNLCLFFDLDNMGKASEVSALTQLEIEAVVRGSENPFDLLLNADVASLVDFGAGDLTFEEQLVERYLPGLESLEKDFILHCQDRLDPETGFGTLVRVAQDRLERLRRHPSPRLQFHFFARQDMFEMTEQAVACDRYTIAVCNSPASPTFAYEPTRFSEGAIARHLRETKGDHRRRSLRGHEVLEVTHGGEVLTFPAWKFDIYGPLMLLDLLSRSGKLCVLSAVDTEVFWELLAQLLPEDSARPRDVFFTAENVGKYFGETHERLSRLAIGERMVLPQVRVDLPRVLFSKETETIRRYTFRYVEVRRGALFPGVPAGTTAHVFEKMTRETAPWFLTLVPAV
jgi:hypothetical protein